MFYGEHVTVDQLCFNIHREMLLHDYHAYNPMQTLYAIERMRDGLDLWLDKLGGEVMRSFEDDSEYEFDDIREVIYEK